MEKLQNWLELEGTCGHTVTTKRDLFQESLVLLKNSAAELRQQAESKRLSPLQKAECNLRAKDRGQSSSGGKQEELLNHLG